MKSVFFVLLAVVVLSGSVAFAAPPELQGPDGPTPPKQIFPLESFTADPGGPRTGEPPGYAPQRSPEMEASPVYPRELHGFRAAEEMPGAAPDVSLGQPGFVLRSVRSFGETGVPYFEDTSHLNWPYAVATDGNNVWIAEEENGHRALKFTSDGHYLAQIGKAGISDYDEETLRNLNDVAVDGSGNVWIVDTDAAHVLKYGPDLSYVSELGELWNHGAGNSQFDQPAGIAFDAAGNIYISDGAPDWGYDAGNHRVQVFDAGGGYLATIGQTGSAGSGNDRLHGPRHLAVYGDRLYVPDSGNHRVQIFNISNPASPVYAGTICATGSAGDDITHFNNPSGVAVDASFIYVADTWNHRIQIFSRSAPYTYQATINQDYGSGNDQFRDPTDVAVDASGNIYVADYRNQRVQQFSAARAYVRTYGSTGVPYLTDGVHFNEPDGVAVARDGSIYVVEERGHRLVKLDSEGVPLWTVGEPGIYGGGDAAHFGDPQDVELDAAGRVYVADNWNNRVQIFNPDGAYYGTLGGQWGTGNYQFDCPAGLAFGPNGELYVADACNHRVQVFDRNLVYVATMGESGVSGSDDGHFKYPQEVAVDSAGVIYVADTDNLRVQVFGPDRAYQRTIGQTGVGGDDFGHFRDPEALAVDAARNVYVGDGWANRVHVYDPAGAYLTSFAVGWGARTGQTKRVQGLAIGPDGAVYVADSWDNHRITQFAPGVPGWKQVNINGFGERENNLISALAPLSGHLYAGTYNWSGNGAQLWRKSGSGGWTAIMQNGFGDDANVAIDHLVEFGGDFYAGTWNENSSPPNYTAGGQIWRSEDGSAWTKVVDAGFGDPTNGEVFRFGVFKDFLYATTWSYTNTHGAEIWRSDTGDGDDWDAVVSNGFGDPKNQVIAGLAEFNGSLYSGTNHYPLGGQVWRSSDGEVWSQINTDGFGNPDNYAVRALAAFEGYLYAGTSNRNATSGAYDGGQIWRCATCDGTDWEQVIGGGFGDTNNRFVYSLIVFSGRLYAVTFNSTTGAEVWRTSDGENWSQVNPDGFGDSNVGGTYFENSVTLFGSRLFIGTNGAAGARVWQNTVTAGFSAIPRQGAAPLNVNFTDESAGDVTSREWDFGDGSAGSTLANPTHEYVKPGLYTVSLTVGDGVDEDTVTKAAYIDTRRRVYLPLVGRNFGDPYLYDDFSNTVYDGSYNPMKWTRGGENNAIFQVRQENGALKFTSSATATASGVNMHTSPSERSWAQLGVFEAKLRLGSDRGGGASSVRIKFGSDTINGDHWETACVLNGAPSWSMTGVYCYVQSASGNEYGVSGPDGGYDAWNTVRIAADPTTAELRFYLNGALLGSHVPGDAAALLTATDFGAYVRIKNDDPNATSTRYVDDVRITPARP